MGVLASYNQANSLLEKGIVAELRGKPEPKCFRASIAALEEAQRQMKLLDARFGELLAIDAAGTEVPEFGEALEKILREERPFERVSLQGVRYANSGGRERDEPTPLKGSRDILLAQREDLRVLERKLAEVLDAYRSALPLAEKAQFVPVMLSGRNAFGDKMPQFTDMMSAYDRFVVRSCMKTIDATMQIYPTGWEWLEEQPAEGGR